MIELHWAVYVLTLLLAITAGYPLGVWQANRQRDKQIEADHRRDIESRKVTMAERAQAIGTGVSVGPDDLKIDGLPSPQPPLMKDSEDAA